MRISISDWFTGGDYFTYRGHQIFFRVDGPTEAPPLLLIHGFPTASWDWEALWPALSSEFRLFTLDLIGFGFSAKPKAYPYKLHDQADLVETFLRHQQVLAYHALVHDYGDTVAQELLARQVEPGARPRLLSLTLLNGGLFPETHRPALIQRLLLSPIGPLVSRLTTKDKFAGNLRKIFGANTQPDSELLDTFWTLLQHNKGLSVMPKLIRYMLERKKFRARWVGALQSAKIPLKLIDGEDDPISGAHMAQRYRELVPNPNITLLAGVGHYPQCEAPEQVLAAYFEFISQVLGPRQ